MSLIVLTTIDDIVGQFSDFIDKLIPQSAIPIIVQLCATAVMFIVVARFVFKPVRALLSKRAEYVNGQIRESEEAKERSLRYEQEAKGSISEAQEKSKAMIADAKRQSEAIREKALEDLDRELRANRLRAEEEILQEKKQAVEDIRRQIVDVALQASETVLNREISSEDNSRLVEDFVKDIVN